MARPLPIRASVVVPVYNPGPAFDGLIESLDAQTLPREQFEVILCDDGSDEATRDRLARVARERSNVRVLTLPRSGWPGAPRNRGVEAARGEYVQFVDQDDRLFEAALEKLCDYADRNVSDVIVGREVGVGRGIPRRIFERDIPRAVLGEDPLLEMLTPHKMFRTSFLRDNDIRFPEGRVRLEDHQFVMQAYFAADTISILASEPCYAWIKHDASASASRIDPETYFPHLAAVLDIVEAHTEPGALRDTLLRHWLRGKILQRLAGRRMVNYPEDYRERFLDVVTPLVQQRFGAEVGAGLPLPNRVRSVLLRADRRDDLLRFAQFESELQCRVEVTSASWSRGGALRLTVRAHVERDGEDALVFASSDSGRRGWRAPAFLDDLPPEVIEVDRDLRADRFDLLLDGADRAERRVAGRRSSVERPAALTIDPLRVFGRDDDSRGGPLRAKVRRAGWSFDAPLTADAAVLRGLGASPLLAGRRCSLVLNRDGVVELRREWPGGSLRDLVGRAVRRARALVGRMSRRLSRRAS